MILVSSCLMGFPCRYDGVIKKHARLVQALSRIGIPVCPEVLGGLTIPRPPAEIQGPASEVQSVAGNWVGAGARVVNVLGQDVTRAYVSGALRALSIGMQAGCKIAILRARSPACGIGVIYDGTFTGALRPGDGVFASLLRAHGFRLYTEDEIDEALLSLEGEVPGTV